MTEHASNKHFKICVTGYVMDVTVALSARFERLSLDLFPPLFL